MPIPAPLVALVAALVVKPAPTPERGENAGKGHSRTNAAGSGGSASLQTARQPPTPGEPGTTPTRRGCRGAKKEFRKRRNPLVFKALVGGFRGLITLKRQGSIDGAGVRAYCTPVGGWLRTGNSPDPTTPTRQAPRGEAPDAKSRTVVRDMAAKGTAGTAGTNTRPFINNSDPPPPDRPGEGSGADG